MTRTELAEAAHQDVETRIREGVQAIIKQTLEEVMIAHMRAACHERSLSGVNLLFVENLQG